jgi:hypothetical protein
MITPEQILECPEFKDVSISRRFILRMLATFQDENGNATVTYKELAEKCGLSGECCRLAIDHWIREGIVTKTSKAPQPNTYRLHLP